jgi:hypothetical protein
MQSENGAKKIKILFLERSNLRLFHADGSRYGQSQIACSTIEIQYYHEDMWDTNLVWCYLTQGWYFSIARNKIKIING